MRLDKKKWIASIMGIPEDVPLQSEEQKKARQLILLLAGDKRTMDQVSLQDISEFFTEAENLLEVFMEYRRTSFNVSELVGCPAGKRRAL